MSVRDLEDETGHSRNLIAGSLIAVGKGEQDIDWFAKVFEAADRNLAAATAPASGLYFVNARYDERFKLPIGHKKPVLF